MTQETRTAGASAGRRALTAVLVAGTLGLTGCSSVPDALNPVEWYHGASDTVGGWFGDDEQPPAEPGRSQAADAGTSPNSAYPNLSTVPSRPTPSTTAEERDALRKGLVADRANARYSGQPQTPASSTSGSTGQGASQAPTPTQQAAVPPPAAEPRPARRVAEQSGERSDLWPNRPAPQTPGLRASTTGRVGDSSRRDTPAVAASSSAPEIAPMPERRAVAETGQMAERTTYDSAGPSASRAAAREPATASAPAPAAPAPSATSQSVIVNEDAIGGGAAPAAASFAGRPYLASTIYFGHGSANLTASERTAIAEIAHAAASTGAAVQVVGHASSRTGDLSLRDHDMANFAISMKRAQSVASALIDAGVPAERVRVEAVSDTQPAFYEVMPSGEAGNRRAEIVLFY